MNTWVGGNLKHIVSVTHYETTKIQEMAEEEIESDEKGRLLMIQRLCDVNSFEGFVILNASHILNIFLIKFKWRTAQHMVA